VDAGDLRDVGHLVDGADFQEAVPEVLLGDQEAAFPEAVEGEVVLEVVVVVGGVVLEVVLGVLVLEVGSVVGEVFEAHNACIQHYILSGPASSLPRYRQRIC